MGIAASFLVAQLAVSSCGDTAVHPTPGKILAVHVKSDGTILIDGKVTSFEQLKSDLVALSKEGGTVRYSRDNPTGDPPPNAMEVIKAIIAEKLPVQMAVPVG